MSNCLLSTRPKFSGRRQRGVAALEFALVFAALFIALYGIVIFGMTLYTQQVVSRSAEDGARAALRIGRNVGADDPRVQEVVYETLASSLITPKAAGTGLAEKKNWLRAHMPPPGVTPPPGDTIVVTVVYPYDTISALPTIRSWTDGWIPRQLTGKATAARPAL